MAEHFQIHNQRNISIEEMLRESSDALPIAGMGPPTPSKSLFILPEDLINNEVSVACLMKPIRWGQGVDTKFISEKIFREIYEHRINNLGLNIETINDEQWQALSKVPFPTPYLNSLEQEVFEDYLKSLVDKAITISIAVITTWLILRKQGKKTINYTFNSEGGDIVLGSADFSTNIYLSSDGQTHIANDILDDNTIMPEISSQEPPISILKRPILLVNNGENSFIPLPLTAGYVSGDSVINSLKPLHRSKKLIKRFFSLFRRHQMSTPQSTSTHVASPFDGLPLEKNPEILEAHFQYSKEGKTYSPPKCLLVIQEKSYLVINKKRIYLSPDIATAIRECINSSASETEISADDININSELGAAYLNGVKRKKWEEWLKKALFPSRKKTN